MNMLYCKFYTGLMYLVILFWQRIISLVLQFCDIYVYSLCPKKYCNSGCTWTNISLCIAIIAFFFGIDEGTILYATALNFTLYAYPCRIWYITFFHYVQIKFIPLSHYTTWLFLDWNVIMIVVMSCFSLNLILSYKIEACVVCITGESLGWAFECLLHEWQTRTGTHIQSSDTMLWGR